MVRKRHLYGANALAGLIYVRSAAPSDTFGGRAEFQAGDYDDPILWCGDHRSGR